MHCRGSGNLDDFVHDHESMGAQTLRLSRKTLQLIECGHTPYAGKECKE
jgi:hypothetical protein